MKHRTGDRHQGGIGIPSPSSLLAPLPSLPRPPLYTHTPFPCPLHTPSSLLALLPCPRGSPPPSPLTHLDSDLLLK